jgi:hypothetical protein
MTAFIVPGNLADRLLEFADNSKGGMPTLPTEMAKSIRVKTLYLRHRKKLKAVGTTSARTTSFDCDELGGKVTVEVYFQKSKSERILQGILAYIHWTEYDTKLRYPDTLPVIDVSTGKRPVWIPAELCEIEPGNAFQGRSATRRHGK